MVVAWPPVFYRSRSPKVVVPKTKALLDSQDADSANAEYPRSKDGSFVYHLAVTDEREAITLLKVGSISQHPLYIYLTVWQNEWESLPHEAFVYDGYKSKKQLMMVDLHDFEVYTSPNDKHWAYELASLELLQLRGRELRFDGVLSIGNV